MSLEIIPPSVYCILEKREVEIFDIEVTWEERYSENPVHPIKCYELQDEASYDLALKVFGNKFMHSDDPKWFPNTILKELYHSNN